MSDQLEESRQWCRKLTRRAAGNFYYSFLTLPRPLFYDMCALYAFMRLTDDIGDDESQDIETRRSSLAEWKERTQQALAGGECHHPSQLALVDLVARHELPVQYLLDVIDGVAFDLDPKPIQTFADLEAYCYQVAGAVGLCCIHIWGFHGKAAIDRAIECGLAFQLTNILRDVREDIERGRVYLPAEDLERFEYSARDLAEFRYDDRFRDLMEFEADRAEHYYSRAAQLCDLLEPAGVPVFTAMLKIYGGLLGRIRAVDFDVFSQRVKLPRWKKLWISMGSAWTHWRNEPEPTTSAANH